LEQKSWLSPGKPLPVLIIMFGIFIIPFCIMYAFSHTEFQYLNNIEIRSYPNLPRSLLIIIPEIMLIGVCLLLFYGKINLINQRKITRYTILFFIALGISFPFIMNLELNPGIPFWINIPRWLATPFSYITAGHMTNGLLGLYISQKEFLTKHPKIFWFITVLGLIFVIFSFMILWWGISGSEMFQFLSQNEFISIFSFLSMFGGHFFLTAGTMGIGKQKLINKKSLYTILALFTIVVVPSLIFASFLYMMTSTLTVGL
jgi:hypothetical protein